MCILQLSKVRNLAWNILKSTTSQAHQRGKKLFMLHALLFNESPCHQI